MSENNIDHPVYYTSGKIETWDFIADKKLNYDRGAAVKYIVRAGKKKKDEEIKDLNKAINYLKHEIKTLEGKCEEEELKDSWADEF